MTDKVRFCSCDVLKTSRIHTDGKSAGGWGEGWVGNGELLFNGYIASVSQEEKQFCGWTAVMADETVLNVTDLYT